jgi:Flp pilus assembly protein TadG
MSVASLRRWQAVEGLRRVRAGLVRRGFVRPKIVSRFGRDKDGAAALEFAFVAGPFLFLLFAIIEVAMVFFAGQVLETATANASRLIMTGQAQTQNFDQAAFKNAVCQKTDVLMSCSGIAVDVRTYASFGSASTSRPTTGTGAVNYGGMSYNQGAGGDIVVVRVVYEWPVLMPSFGLTIGDLPNGKRLLMATAAFRNEPF